MKRLALLAGLAVVLVGVSACNSPTQGQPAPAITTTGSQSGDTSTAVGGEKTLPADQPCSLLASSDLSQIGASAPPTQDMVGTAHDCSLMTPNFDIGVAIRTNVGVAGFNAAGGAVHAITIGTHQAKQEVDNTGSCVIAIGVSDSSRVDVTVQPISTGDPCPLASTLANLIEPKLP